MNKIQMWGKALESWGDVMYDIDGYGIEFTQIDEGNSGDYDPEDPNDVPRLRFYCHKIIDGEYVEIEDTSHCTMLTPLASEAVLQRYAELVANAVDSAYTKHRLAEITWITE